jgi:hypothetical protein
LAMAGFDDDVDGGTGGDADYGEACFSEDVGQLGDAGLVAEAELSCLGQ